MYKWELYSYYYNIVKKNLSIAFSQEELSFVYALYKRVIKVCRFIYIYRLVVSTKNVDESVNHHRLMK